MNEMIHVKVKSLRLAVGYCCFPRVPDLL